MSARGAPDRAAPAWRGWLTRSRRELAVAAIFAAVALAYGLGGFAPVQRALMDRSFRLLPRDPSGGLVVVAIDSRSLHALATWPWPREYYAKALEHLVTAGATEVALDVDFSATSTASGDAALAAALKRAQGKVILPTFAQRSTLAAGDRAVSHSVPAPPFRGLARLGAVNVFPAPDGLIREYSPAIVYGDETVPSSATLLAGAVPVPSGDFYLDYGIRTDRLKVLSFADVLAGRFDPAIVAGRKIILGATAVELGDQFAVPLHRALAGPLLQALAYESLVQGRALHRSGGVVTLGLTLLVLVLLYRPLSASGWRRGLAALLAAVAALYGLALAAQAAAPISLDIAPALAGAVALYAIGVLRELERQARAALKHRMSDMHRRAMMQCVLEDSFDGIVIADADGKVELINAAGARLLGRASAEMARKPVELFLPGATARQEAALTARTRDPDQGRDAHAPVECRLTRPDGKEMVIEHLASCSVLRVTGDRQERRHADRFVFIHTFRDISERKTNEARLRDAMRAALAASRAKSEFLANMSHELRTPLNAIIGFSEMIRDGVLEPVGERSRDYAGAIHSSGQHLLSLIGDVLDLAKIETGRFDLHEEEVALGALVSECLPLIDQRAAAGGIAFTALLPADLPPLWADPLRLKQIVLNLLSNAVKFTPLGGRVAIAASIAPSGGAEIRVEDSGIGMKAEDIPAALEPFRQLESAFSRRHEGTGLGLPLVKSLTDLHGGTLEIDSVPGRGTIVRVTLPPERVLTARAARPSAA